MADKMAEDEQAPALDKPSVEDAYPHFFKGGVSRARLWELLDDGSSPDVPYDWHIMGWDFEPATGEIAEQRFAVRDKKIEHIVLKHLLVYSSPRLLTQALKQSFPEVSTASVEFEALRITAYLSFAEFQDEFLWGHNGFFGLIRDLFTEGGLNPDEFDPRKRELEREHLRHNRDVFLRSKLDRETWEGYFAHIFDDVIDWDWTFGSGWHAGLSNWHLETVFLAMCDKVGRVVFEENRLNGPDAEYPGPSASGRGGDGGTASSLSPGDDDDEAPCWIEDKVGRARAIVFFEGLGRYREFEGIEIESYDWKDKEQPVGTWEEIADTLSVDLRYNRRRPVPLEAPRSS